MSLTEPSEPQSGRAAIAPDGALLPDDDARALLGLGPGDGIDGFAILDEEGRPRAGEAAPWRGADAFDESQVWLAKGARPLHLRVIGDASRLTLGRLPERGPLLRIAGSVSEALFDEPSDPLAATARVLGRFAFAFGAEALCLLVPGRAGLRVQSLHGTVTAGLAHLLEGTGSPEPALAEVLQPAQAPALHQPLELLLEELDCAWARALAERGLQRAIASPIGTSRKHLLLFARRCSARLTDDERSALEAACRAWAAALRSGRQGFAQLRAQSGLKAVSAAALDRDSAADRASVPLSIAIPEPHRVGIPEPHWVGIPEPPLRELLRILVEQACTLARARYGAMGVLDSTGKELVDFITVGMSDEDFRRIGHLPEGKGLLGAVVREAKTIRVADLSHDPRAVGFPAHHPPMRSFLGVPLRLGPEIFGNFYLTEKEDGAEFTEDDARLLEAFSAQAALTVAYARETGAQRLLLDSVLRQAPHGILFFAGPDEITFCNAAARLMLGLPDSGPVRRSYRLLHPDGAPFADEDYPAGRALKGQQVVNLEVRVERSDGSVLPAFTSAGPVRSETGVLLGAVVAFQDLTPFKELERVREEFSAVVAHDLRNPLQAMMLGLEAQSRRANGESVSVPVGVLDGMQRAGKRLQHLISDLLDAARIESGRVSLELRPTELPRLVSSLVQLTAPTLGHRRVTVSVDGRPGSVLADAVRIEQVLTNLLENAAKYSAEGGGIDVRVCAQAGGATVAVSDRGAGILPEDLPRLFNRHYQTERARKKSSGLGLGLFIAKGLIEAHHGRLWAESSPGQGSTFSVWLPAAPSAS